MIREVRVRSGMLVAKGRCRLTGPHDPCRDNNTSSAIQTERSLHRGPKSGPKIRAWASRSCRRGDNVPLNDRAANDM